MEWPKAAWRVAGLLAATGIVALLIAVLPLTSRAQTAGNVIHVNINTAPGGDGTTWGTAYRYLQDGIAAATAGDEIWVAQGTYYPDEGAGVTDDDRTASFLLNSGVKIYGGFAGTESTLNQRNWVANPTVLSGDIDQDASTDGCDAYPDPCGPTKNSLHVVTSVPDTNNAPVLDGFTISGGRAGPNDGAGLQGAGIRLKPNTPWVTKWPVTLRNLTVTDNVNYNGLGGGVFAEFVTLTMINVTLANNQANSGGGLLLIASDYSLQNIVARNNHVTTHGAGIEIAVPQVNPPLTSAGTILDADISGNSAGWYGAGITFNWTTIQGANWRVTGNSVEILDILEGLQSRGAGIFTDSALRGSKLTNITVTGNRIVNPAFAMGAGMALTCWRVACDLTIANSVIYGNSTSQGDSPNIAPPFNSHQGVVAFQNSLIQDSGGSSDWKIPNTQDLGGNIDADPQFLVPIDAAGAPTTAGNFRPTLGSPIINAGNNSLILGNPAISTDLAGNARIYDTTVDMGAYETQITCPAGGTTRLYVSSTATGAGTGTSWTDALPRLQDAVTLVDGCANNSIAEVWVAQGTYYPDEGNNVVGDDRAAAFPLRNGLAIFGGFVGSETDLDQRNPWSYITTLSGDIGQDDRTDANDLVETPADIVGDNSYHVVVGSGTDATAVLDGFAITGGQANGSVAAKQHEGGGLFAEAGSPTLNNLALVGNIAEEGGAMTLVGGSNPAISNAWFGGNAASDYGGALHNESSNPVLTNVQMSGNRAAAGGGAIYNLASSPELTNVTIAGNTAGGTVSLPRVTPAAVNIAPAGGGILNFTGSKPDIRNSIIWANQDSTGTGTASASMRNLDTSSTPSADHSDIQGLAGITGLLFDGTSIDADPQFVVVVDPASAPAFTPAVALKGTSPAIDTGNDTFNGLAIDLGQDPRIQGAAIDMGAFEAVPAPHVALHKSANTPTAKVGETVTYTYQIVNTGAVTLTTINAVDDVLGLIDFGVSALAPAATATATLSYTVVEGDLPGPLANTATVTATSSVSGTVVASDTTAVSLSYRPRLTVQITPSQTNVKPGETVTYTVHVENTGDVTLTALTATDDRLGVVVLNTNTLAPGATASGSLTYTVQSGDLPGPVMDTVTAAGTSPLGTQVRATESAAVAVVDSRPSIPPTIYLPIVRK